jgi:hypothetical protein
VRCSPCDDRWVSFDLGLLAVGVEAKGRVWTALGVGWQLQPISPNYGKPIVAGVFESATWIGEVTIWITGETELGTIRLADGWNVNKHYDLTSMDDLAGLLEELAALIGQGKVHDASGQ